MKYLNIESTVNRDAEGLATSVVYSIKTYSQVDSETVTIQVDADGTTEEISTDVFNESYLLETRAHEYTIPVEDRTTAYHGSAHPHDHDMEIEFQTKSAKWFEDFTNSSAYTDILAEIWE